ncbi:HD domain-containing protein [Rossellomorea vietnamensis]|uniref:HD domain-containing protein n=1 Tax=Rossellomorea vietnamensis TaxID=218284 RepID=A0A5D4KJT5_9BACI|nr:HD domain-containing protein [Rossellomorea vietnamensis]TYR76543.1 HD domain-containing protein [Rossellomorea vietnamensis]
MKNNLKLLEELVKEIHAGDSSGHDWYHIDRVRNLALYIGRNEGSCHLDRIEAAALLHDVADDKLNESEQEGQDKLHRVLNSIELHNEEKEKILDIISVISYRGGQEGTLDTLEAKAVRDADRLDAVGAIGIARTFAYGGKKGNPIYVPGLSVRENMTHDEYRNGQSSTIHHFYEKLLLLKDKMCTETGKEVAEERHQFMELFLKQFYKEWNGQQ